MCVPTKKPRRVSLSLQQAVKVDDTQLSGNGHDEKIHKSPLHQQPFSETVSTENSNSCQTDLCQKPYRGSFSEEELCHVIYDSSAPCISDSFSNILDDYHVFPTILGTGHYGCVRECIHKESRQPFAVKSIDKSRIGRLDHLRREVSLLRAVDHSGVMKMIDYYEDSDYIHIVTEKYTGGELFDKIIGNTTDEGCFSEAEAARIIKSLLEAVKYLHEKDIVHRDIKPENIMFESKQEGSAVKLIDFGLSRKHRQGEDLMSTPVGTAYYMSPEILKGEYDRSCDVWAVGVVTYILLCGYPPFNGDSDPDIFDAIKKGMFDFPEEQWDDISKEAKKFIKGLLRRDPKKRKSPQEALKHKWIVGLLER